MVSQVNDQPTTEATPVLTVTPTAVTKIKELLSAREMVDHHLRVFVSGGGCSGLQYGMAIEKNVEEYDAHVEVDGVSLLVDPTSLQYLQGAHIDYVDSLMGGGFRIDNPNAVSSCGCGHSFRSEGGEAAGGGSCSTCG